MEYFCSNKTLYIFPRTKRTKIETKKQTYETSVKHKSKI